MNYLVRFGLGFVCGCLYGLDSDGIKSVVVRSFDEVDVNMNDDDDSR